MVKAFEERAKTTKKTYDERQAEEKKNPDDPKDKKVMQHEATHHHDRDVYTSDLCLEVNARKIQNASGTRKDKGTDKQDKVMTVSAPKVCLMSTLPGCVSHSPSNTHTNSSQASLAGHGSNPSNQSIGRRTFLPTR
jgi:hypothetical protein